MCTVIPSSSIAALADMTEETEDVVNARRMNGVASMPKPREAKPSQNNQPFELEV